MALEDRRKRRRRRSGKTGGLYAEGKGVPKGETKASEWYKKAAIQGDNFAQFNLGEMYAEGRGVPKDETKAVECYQKAATQGNEPAQLSLGNMYLEGKGVTKNDVRGYACYSLATALHNNAAKKHQDGLEKQMTPPQKAAAQKLTTDFFSRMPKQQFQCAISLSGLGRMRDATGGRAQETPLQRRVKNFHLHAFSRRRSFLRCLQRSPQAHLLNCSGKKRGK